MGRNVDKRLGSYYQESGEMKNSKFESMLYAQKQQGFTLVELMIVVAIIGILAAIAYPSYTQYVVKSNRTAAESFITSITSKQQQYMLDARAYADNIAALGYTSIDKFPSEVSKNYTVTIGGVDNTATPPIYTVTATPTGTQAIRDTKCGSVSLNQTGTKGISGTGTVADCW